MAAISTEPGEAGRANEQRLILIENIAEPMWLGNRRGSVDRPSRDVTFSYARCFERRLVVTDTTLGVALTPA